MSFLTSGHFHFVRRHEGPQRIFLIWQRLHTRKNEDYLTFYILELILKVLMPLLWLNIRSQFFNVFFDFRPLSFCQKARGATTHFFNLAEATHERMKTT